MLLTRMPTLRDLLSNIDAMDPDSTIYTPGQRPLTLDSPAMAAREPDSGSFPREAAGMEYLLEVRLAQEAMEVWSVWRDGRQPTTEEKLAAVAFYADHDSYLPRDQ